MAFDEIDRKLIDMLSENSRISMRDLSKQVNMSAPSVKERVRRLMERGAIKFTIELDPSVFGYSLQCIIRVKPMPGQLHLLERVIQEIPECVECVKVTGDDCFIVRLCLRSIEDLDEVLSPIKDKAETNTSIIHSTPVPSRIPPI